MVLGGEMEPWGWERGWAEGVMVRGGSVMVMTSVVEKYVREPRSHWLD